MEKTESPLIGPAPAAGSTTKCASQFATPNSLKCKTNKYFQLFPVINTNTPPRLMKVRNPFEMFERLHLPACSPLLLKRPASRSTPQRPSDHFEWTIDEISSMKPVHLEPHDTQFQTPHDYDSETEARAQAAIMSYFNEHEIVPSPADCPLRNQKIVLPEELMETSHVTLNKSKAKVKKTADGTAQTILTFPPILPKNVEDLLKPYFSYTVDQQQSPNDCDKAMKDYYDARDASLRRKLFATDDSSETSSVGPANHSLDDIDFDSMSPAPQTPDLNNVEPKSHIDSLSPIVERRESFGALSPIQRTAEELTADEETSPAVNEPPKRSSESEFSSTPEKQSPRDHLSMSIDDVPRHHPGKALITSLHSMFDSHADDWDDYEDSISNYLTQEEEPSACIAPDLNISQDFYRPAYSQDDHNTPLRPRTLASRKNLSRSFNMLTNCSDDELPDEVMVMARRTKKSKSISTSFRRMDSGFNDDYSQPSMVEASSQRRKSNGLGRVEDFDISMQSQDENDVFICSTPSKLCCK